MDEIERIKALAERAMDPPWTLLSQNETKEGTLERVHFASLGACGCCESPWMDKPDAEFIVALANAWPSLLARIEAGEKLAEAAERFIDNNCEACMGEICHRCREARAALAAFAAAKEVPRV